MRTPTKGFSWFVTWCSLNVFTGKILIIDDAPAVVSSMKMALGALGITEGQITVGHSAEEAWQLIAADPPDLIFLDVGLGDGQGDELAKAWLKEEPTRRIVMITGLDLGDPRVREAVSAGVYDVIQKPIRFQRIRQVMDLIASETQGLRRL